MAAGMMRMRRWRPLLRRLTTNRRNSRRNPLFSTRPATLSGALMQEWDLDLEAVAGTCSMQSSVLQRGILSLSFFSYFWSICREKPKGGIKGFFRSPGLSTDSRKHPSRAATSTHERVIAPPMQPATSSPIQNEGQEPAESFDNHELPSNSELQDDSAAGSESHNPILFVLLKE